MSNYLPWQETRRLGPASLSARGGETWRLHNDTECLNNFSVANWWVW